MKIVYTGGEFLLSNYLNCLKIPMVLFFVVVGIITLVDCAGNETPFKETYLYRNRYWLIVLAVLSNLYMFVFWH